MKRKFSVTTAFNDVLFNIILGFFILLVLSVMLINPPAKEGDVLLNAEFLITMEWDKNSINDVDLWVQSPKKGIVWYQSREIDNMHLDRDSLGSYSNVVRFSDGTAEVADANWEHVTIRGSTPGEYAINVMLFSMKDARPTKVKVKVEKLNPYKLVYTTTVTLTRQSQEITIARFKVNRKKEVVNLNKDPISLIRKISPAGGR